MSSIERIYLARHGRTEWNVAGRRQGRLDSPLTPDAIEHTKGLAQVVAGAPVDGIFASPLGRAAATAAIFAKALDLDVTTVEELAEVDHGSMSGLTNAEIEARYPGEPERRRRDKYRWSFPGGESYADADRRAAAALRIVADAGCRVPLVVSHEMIGRMLLRHLLDLAPADALALDHPHDVVFRVEPAAKRLTELRA